MASYKVSLDSLYDTGDCFVEYTDTVEYTVSTLYVHVLGTGVYLEGDKRIRELRNLLNRLNLETQ